MSVGGRVRYAGLLVAAIALAFVEVMFLPMRLDGRLLPDLGAIPFPITVVLAALTLPWLVSRAARLVTRPAAAGGPLYAWLAALAAMVVVAPGGDMIIIPDWRTLLLLAAGAFPATARIGDALGRAAAARTQQTGGTAKGV